MKVARFNGGRIGVVRDDGIVDVTDAIDARPDAWPPMEMVRLIADFAALGERLRTAGGPLLPLAEVRLQTPVPWPNKVIAFPVNYTDHGKEMNSPYRADIQGFFVKATSSLSGCADPIELPELPDREFHHECELALVIGKQGRRISRENALEHIFGYSCLVDVTVRGKGERVMRKSFDSFCPVGPWIVTADEIADPDDLELKLWVDDELRQHANSRDLIVDVAGMIEMASSVCTLYPGDIIATGTPAGVGPIVPGNRVTIEIESVGRMSLDVIRGQGGTNTAFQAE